MEKQKPPPMIQNDHRLMRSKKFASTIMAVLRDHLPSAASRDAYSLLVDEAYKANAMLINVPDEYDYLTAKEVERRVSEDMMKPFALKLGKVDAD